ncbi:hypothetical protein ABB37_00144 [Leptomonas pyrrhocoris]|uniref:Uncharacterized protein n=1 Tax=Leptomonas pyrrhocoris TaxID=157538 RepID=A0A0N0VHS5_LEPPY|nr:hypothetical protein ABB37_00144 [Leptomonas pyrrhocoris]KPA85798.1 hypothetical protein ABB37_00144 [Leptomonas pyrrhocoris]|eukprot:XP_015664237.1 hypothetical protein ABB37_00144 [Leptomonas pyrrhocoris]
MRRTNTVAVEDPPRRGTRGAVPASATREYGVAPRPSKRMLNREIGVLLLVLAAQTIMGVVNMDNALSTELMAESESFHGRPSLNNKHYSHSSCYYSSASSADKEMPYLDVSEGMSSSGTSSDASESCDDDRDEEDVAAALLASRLTIPRRANQRFAHDEDVWENIFSSLPWDAATQARELSKFHFGESLAHVTIARMPQSKTVALFIPCPEDLDGDDMAVEAELAPRLASADGASGSSGQRLFLGQLRRTGTVPMVRWLVNTVFNAPPGALVSVENRRNTRTQRGKGCAWATISDAATVERMLGAHHRLFFDTVDGVEGVWLVPEGYEDALQTEVSLRSEGSAHPKHMPRGTIVVEDALDGGATRTCCDACPREGVLSRCSPWSRKELCRKCATLRPRSAIRVRDDELERGRALSLPPDVRRDAAAAADATERRDGWRPLCEFHAIPRARC